MIIEGLLIPDQLHSLFDAGKWPRNVDEAARQYTLSLVGEDRNRRLRRIFLHPPRPAIGFEVKS